MVTRLVYTKGLENEILNQIADIIKENPGMYSKISSYDLYESDIVNYIDNPTKWKNDIQRKLDKMPVKEISNSIELRLHRGSGNKIIYHNVTKENKYTSESEYEINKTGSSNTSVSINFVLEEYTTLATMTYADFDNITHTQAKIIYEKADKLISSGKLTPEQIVEMKRVMMKISSMFVITSEQLNQKKSKYKDKTLASKKVYVDMHMKERLIKLLQGERFDVYQKLLISKLEAMDVWKLNRLYAEKPYLFDIYFAINSEGWSLDEFEERHSEYSGFYELIKEYEGLSNE